MSCFDANDNRKSGSYASDARDIEVNSQPQTVVGQKWRTMGCLMKQDKKLFLVVEDFEDSRFMMRRLLELAGYNVVEASDGEQAVKLAVQERPELILMDLSLPKLDGLAATKKIRMEPGFDQVPIVAVSAHDSPQTRSEAKEAGCTEYVVKPIDFDQLNALLSRVLPSARN